MKVKLKSGHKSCTHYGIVFDDNGVATVDDKVVESLIDADVVVEVKTATKKAK